MVPVLWGEKPRNSVMKRVVSTVRFARRWMSNSNTNAQDETFLLDIVSSRMSLRATHVLRALELCHGKFDSPLYPLLAIRVALLGRWTPPAECFVDNSTTFSSQPTDDGGAFVTGMAMLQQYQALQCRVQGSLEVHLTSEKRTSHKDLLLLERAKEALPGMIAEQAILDCFVKQVRLPEDVARSISFLVPAKDNEVMLLPGSRLPLFCSRDRLLHAVIKSDVGAVRMSPIDCDRFSDRGVKAFVLSVGFDHTPISLERELFRKVFSLMD